MRRENEKHSQQMETESFEAYGQYAYEYAYDPTVNTGDAVRKAKEANRKRQKNGFFKFMALLTITTIGVVVAQEMLFKLETVYVVGNQTKSPQQVVTASGLVRGRNMLGIEEADVAEAFAKDHTIIFKGMQKQYPNTIYLYIEERHAVASMQWLGVLYTLDAEGMVMTEKHSTVLPEGMPLVIGLNPTSIHVGQKIVVRAEERLKAYKEILSELSQQLYLAQVKEINLSDPKNLYLLTVDGVTVRLGDSSVMRAKIGSLRSIIGRLRELGKRDGVLDVTTPEDAKYMPED